MQVFNHMFDTSQEKEKDAHTGLLYMSYSFYALTCYAVGFTWKI